ncbi:MAG: cyclic-di-AMP receptor [Oscillospiraceae bacterium]|nr:cyclic-di-AMP receptor [Oscillospiraceae bacterium]
MKLVFAIVSKDDSAVVSAALTQDGFFVTKLASSGGFLKAGNATLMICTDDCRVEELVKTVKLYCKKRVQTVQSEPSEESEFIPYNIEYSVSGATIFITNVERFEKI